MKFRISWRLILPRTRSILGWSRHFFLIIGILTLSYVGLAVLDAKLYQAYEIWRFDKAVKEMGPRSGDSLLPALPAALTEANHVRPESLGIAAGVGSPLGLIEIRTIGLEVMILEGTNAGVLRRGAGHIPGTSLPGRQGNIVIAGHRDTFFRPLRRIRKNDEITLTTLDGSYRYRVDSTQVIEPENTQVLAKSDDSILTLVTCYPFNLVGSAPQRFIVRAHKVP